MHTSKIHETGQLFNNGYRQIKCSMFDKLLTQIIDVFKTIYLGWKILNL